MAPMRLSLSYVVVAKGVGLKPADVKGAVEGIMTLAAKQIKKSGKFNVGGMIMLKLKNAKLKNATVATLKNAKLRNPNMKNAKLTAIPLKRLKAMVSNPLIE